MARKGKREDVQQTFRQFAWNLAGVIASTKGVPKPPPKPAGSR